MNTPDAWLQHIQAQATATLHTSVIADAAMRERVDDVCRCMSNRAGVRLLMACFAGQTRQAPC